MFGWRTKKAIPSRESLACDRADVLAILSDRMLERECGYLIERAEMEIPALLARLDTIYSALEIHDANTSNHVAPSRSARKKNLIRLSADAPDQANPVARFRTPR
ncbi:MAG: hypothetical protein EON58_04145 [Alphaproteobacteria bacterium]|nr:MAG: hypothetical protein EON58_04145 [Alphaproteobacteria bacterium]